MSNRISDADLLALVEACLDVCMPLRGIVREVREVIDCNLHKAIQATERGLTLAANRGSAVAMLLLRERANYRKSVRS